MTWTSEAACAPHRRPEGVTPQQWTDLFFPRRGESTRPAVAICDGCPVQAECLAASFDWPREKDGVWGGMSERQRRRMRAGGERTRKHPPEVYEQVRALALAGCTDEQIASQIGVPSRSVQWIRRSAGIAKDNQGRLEAAS